MTESSHIRTTEDDDGSCDSDSAETVVLGDDLGYDRCNKGISFLRFMSVEGRNTDGDLLLSKPRLSDLPTGLSILKNHVNFTETSLPPGSFSFKECLIKMDMDSQDKGFVENSYPVSSAPDSTTHSPNVDAKTLPDHTNHVLTSVLDPIMIPPNSASPQIAPRSEGSSPDGQFKQPRSIPISELRCKNREAARKSRAKKKNYIQQLEHDFKELKEKYASMQQENADLRRFIFQHFGVNFSSPKSQSSSKTPAARSSSNQPLTTVKQIAPVLPVSVESNTSHSTAATAPPISVMLNGTSGVQESVKKPTLVRNEFGLVPPMYVGLSGNRALTSEVSGVAPHPAAVAEAQRGEAAWHAQSMRALRATQGLQAPLRLAMEERVMEKMSPRLPGLYARHPLAAQLSGALDTIDLCDILNNPEDAEVMGSPHILMEHKLGIL